MATFCRGLRVPRVITKPQRDELGDIAWPAALDRQPREVDVVTYQGFMFERGFAHLLRRDVRQLREFGPGRQRLFQAGRPAWFLDRGQQFAQFAQAGDWPPGECGLDPVAVAEQVAEVRMAGTDRLFHQ